MLRISFEQLTDDDNDDDDDDNDDNDDYDDGLVLEKTQSCCEFVANWLREVKRV